MNYIIYFKSEITSSLNITLAHINTVYPNMSYSIARIPCKLVTTMKHWLDTLQINNNSDTLSRDHAD